MNSDDSQVQIPELEDRLTNAIIGAAFEVHNELGGGLHEALYERALAIELQARGMRVETQVRGTMTYKGESIGQFAADMMVDGLVVVELKSAEAIVEAHVRQVANYARVLGLKVGLILNFGPPRVGVRRILNTFERNGRR